MTLPRQRTEFSNEFKFRFAGWVGGGLLRALGATWKIEWDIPASVVALNESGHHFIHAFWHDQILSMSYSHRGRPLVVLISQSADGEYIAQTIHELGYGTVRGSSSRGGLRALVEMSRLGKEGYPIGISPDGPRGPRHRLQPGVFTIAARSGLPIVAHVAGVRRSKRLKSWDRFQIPYPFAHIRIFAGDPISVPPGASREIIESECSARLQASFDELVTRAAAFTAGQESS